MVDRLAIFFQERPNQWIPGLELASVAGAYAWRSRISDARRKFAMNISNRQRRLVKADGSVFVISEYCFTPAPLNDGEHSSSLLFPLHRQVDL